VRHLLAPLLHEVTGLGSSSAGGQPRIVRRSSSMTGLPSTGSRRPIAMKLSPRQSFAQKDRARSP